MNLRALGLAAAAAGVSLTCSCATAAGPGAPHATATPSVVTAAVPATATPSTPATPTTTATPSPQSALTDHQLAAAVMFGCADSRDTGEQRQIARAGIGGIVLLGSSPPPDLKARLASVQRAAPNGRHPIIASDEEGGSVQRLAPLIYRLPSAETMGSWPTRRLRSTAQRYAARMAGLGVRMSLAPVADLKVPGTYMDQLNRAFGADPAKVGRDVIAWSAGLRQSGVAAVVKHWPGHGHAADTHQFAAHVPPLSQLQRADMIPFEMAVESGVPAVMVAHVQARGLTAKGVPATESSHAMRILRDQVGSETVIITDSLSMAAASSARGLSQSQAVVAALRAGADWAMICSAATTGIIRAVTHAIDRGDLPRARLEQSAARIATLKHAY